MPEWLRKVARRRLLVGLFVLVVATGVAFLVVRRVTRRDLLAIDAVPADAFLVITLDIDALRRSPIGAPLFGGAKSQLVGEKTLTGLCGFDPLARMSELAIAVPEKGQPGEFGVVVRADVSREELLGCAKKIIEARRAGGQGEPIVRESGSYTLVEPEGEGTHPSHGLPTLAYRRGGPFIIARGTWLMTMIDTVEGRVPSVRSNEDHMSLRRELGQADEKAPQLAMAVTALLPREVRERVREEMSTELGPAGGGGSPDSQARSTQIMAGVLGVASVGLGITAGPAGAESQVVGVVRCEEASECREVELLLGKKRLDWSQSFGVRLVGTGPLLDSMKIESHDAALRVTAHAPTNEAASWLERVLELRGLRHPTPRTPLVRPSATPQPEPDEVLRPLRDASLPRDVGPNAP